MKSHYFVRELLLTFATTAINYICLSLQSLTNNFFHYLWNFRFLKCVTRMSDHHSRLNTSKHKKTKIIQNFQDSCLRVLTLIPSPIFTNDLTNWQQHFNENDKSFQLSVMKSKNQNKLTKLSDIHILTANDKLLEEILCVYEIKPMYIQNQSQKLRFSEMLARQNLVG